MIILLLPISIFFLHNILYILCLLQKKWNLVFIYSLYIFNFSGSFNVDDKFERHCIVFSECQTNIATPRTEKLYLYIF